MGISAIQRLMQEGIFEVLKIIALPLGSALVIGLIIAIFQATTSIQEQTLTFLPKLVVILVAIALLAPLIFTDLGQYTIRLFSMIGKM